MSASQHDDDQYSDSSAVWIRSAADKSGHYHCVLELGPDDILPLTAALAYRWAREVLSAVAAAEYDAALLRQMEHMEFGEPAKLSVLSEVRADRASEVPSSLVPGLSLKPGVSQRTGDGFLILSRHGRPVGEWSMDAAKEHALAVLTVVEVAILDGAYLRVLERFGIDRDRALQAVNDVESFRNKEDSK